MEPWYATGARKTLAEEDLKGGPLLGGSVRELFARPDWLGFVSRRTVAADAVAGLTGATLVLPQCVAFAAIAGLPPQYGFYSAIVPAIVAALFGSSWHAVTGPTAAMSALVFGSLSGIFAPGSPEFVSAAIAMALFVGVFQLVLGLARAGVVVDFVSQSVMTGFVAGTALLIGLGQLRHALGLDLPRPEHFIDFADSLVRQVASTDLRALAIALVGLAVGVAIRALRPNWPNYLFALVAATLVSLAFGGAAAGVQTVGAIDSVVPRLEVPSLAFGHVRELTSGSLALAIVGLLSAMSVARPLAQKSGQLIDGNREFVGQGLANAVGSFFQCYPSSSSFTRSGVNLDAGARTPLSAIFAAVFLALILVFVAPLFSYVPIAGMAGVIILVAWRLIEWGEIRHILETSRGETAIAGVTLAATLFVSLEFAIYAGVFMSLVLFLSRIARPIAGVSAPDPSTPSRQFRSARLYRLEECPQLIIPRLDGPLYFGTVEAIRREFRRYRLERPEQKHILFITTGVGEIDMPAAELLIEEARRRERIGGSLHLKVLSLRTIDKLARFRVVKALGKGNIHLSKQDAIAAIVPRLDPSICATCTARIFRECPGGGATVHSANGRRPEPALASGSEKHAKTERVNREIQPAGELAK